MAQLQFDAVSAGISSSGVPAAPEGIVVEAGDTMVDLAWQAVSDADVYNVKRAVVSGGPYDQVTSTEFTNYVDTGLINGQVYYYVVTATNNGGEGPVSAETSAIPSSVVQPEEY